MSVASGRIHEHGELGLIVLNGCHEIGQKIDRHIKAMRGEEDQPGSYIIPIDQVRFSNGEGKVKIRETVRGKDIYIIADVGNYSCTYRMFGFETHMGPDEHLQDIKRVISAIAGKANRVTLMMPLLYASRQHKRKDRESLDCSLALQELERLGVEVLLTFDAHDPTIQNAIPLVSFENLYPTYTILKAFLNSDECKNFDRNNLMVISPDTGAMDRAIYYANVLRVDVGMFYKRRDHLRIVNGKNPIIQHEYIGADVEGKDVLIVDDMIASGESVFDIIVELKKRKAARVFVSTTFAFFTEGVERFEQFYRDGMLNKVFSTNLTYLNPKALEGEWFHLVDMSKFMGKIINTLNHDSSIAPLMDATPKIRKMMDELGLS
ncbi:MAG: ribose-phosphate pyrophosphokinase [Clostridiales bacterium]|nr:ribose-phosphate pyrophosphokinase [Clostridiales bacterium]